MLAPHMKGGICRLLTLVPRHEAHVESSSQALCCVTSVRTKVGGLAQSPPRQSFGAQIQTSARLPRFLTL